MNEQPWFATRQFQSIPELRTFYSDDFYSYVKTIYNLKLKKQLLFNLNTILISYGKVLNIFYKKFTMSQFYKKHKNQKSNHQTIPTLQQKFLKITKEMAHHQQ